jgi:hypothetical protein
VQRDAEEKQDQAARITSAYLCVLCSEYVFALNVAKDSNGIQFSYYAAHVIVFSSDKASRFGNCCVSCLNLSID